MHDWCWPGVDCICSGRRRIRLHTNLVTVNRELAFASRITMTISVILLPSLASESQTHAVQTYFVICGARDIGVIGIKNQLINSII